MNSSISHFKSRIPWQALRLLIVALMAWAGSAFYSLYLHPEMIFLRHCAKVKQDWKHTLERDHKSKIVIYGGSSCLTSIDGERMEKVHGLPVLNLGFHAGIGARVLTRYTLPTLNPGDTLIVALEPDLLTGSLEPPAQGVQFSFATGRLDALRNGDRMHWTGSLLALRPGSEYIFTVLGKVMLHRPLHRYSVAEIHPSGWHEVAERREFSVSPISDRKLSNDAKELLRSLRDRCAQHQIRVAYSMPWHYSPQDEVAERQRHNLDFLQQISEILPVINDPRLGVYPVREHYADTPLHLTAEGAALRTDELAQQINAWQTMPESTNK